MFCVEDGQRSSSHGRRLHFCRYDCSLQLEPRTDCIPGLGEERKKDLCPSRTLCAFRAPLQSAFRQPIKAALPNWHVRTQPCGRVGTTLYPHLLPSVSSPTSHFIPIHACEVGGGGILTVSKKPPAVFPCSFLQVAPVICSIHTHSKYHSGLAELGM